MERARKDVTILKVAAVGIPLAATAFLVALGIHSDQPWSHVVLPAVAGVALGLVFVVVGVSQPAAGGRAREVGQIGFLVILGAALLGTFSGALPTWIRAFLDGWAVGFFVAFAVRLRESLK
jgi:hypothetical protein